MYERSADPDQMFSLEASLSKSTLFSEQDISVLSHPR